MASDPDHELAMRMRMSHGFMHVVPHNQALGIRVVALGAGEATMALPYDAKLVGNPETGVLHGGAITSLMDACSGAAVFMKLTTLAPIATLNLRIDYLKPATPGREVIAHAVCYKLTRSVAFVRCMAHCNLEPGDEADPIASAAGAFMLSTQPLRVGSDK